MRTLVFIPAYDEEETVAGVVREVQGRIPGVDVLVVDDGSTDATAARAGEAGAIVASLPFNQGLGAALQTGYIYALRHGYDFCAHLDADGQHPPEALHALLREVWEDRCDLALGSRYSTPSVEDLERAYSPTFGRKVGIAVFRRLLSFTTRHRFTDTTSGLRAANRRVMRLFADYYAPDFAELESLQRAVRQRVRVKELQVEMRPRLAGTSKITPFQSIFFVVKGLLVLFVGGLRRAQVEHSDVRAESSSQPEPSRQVS